MLNLCLLAVLLLSIVAIVYMYSDIESFKCVNAENRPAIYGARKKHATLCYKFGCPPWFTKIYDGKKTSNRQQKPVTTKFDDHILSANTQMQIDMKEGNTCAPADYTKFKQMKEQLVKQSTMLKSLTNENILLKQQLNQTLTGK